MTGLKCTTCNCEHNVCCHCNAGVINVSKKGVCQTKQKRDLGILEQNKVNMEAAKEFSYEDNEDVFIQCDCAECKYNRDLTCSSKIVDIADGLLKTRCFTKRLQK